MKALEHPFQAAALRPIQTGMMQAPALPAEIRLEEAALLIASITPAARNLAHALHARDHTPTETRTTRELACLAEWERLLPKVDTVCFDVFDTLLVRLVAKPVDVFAEVAALARDLLPSHLTPAGFTEIRVDSERSLRLVRKHRGERPEVRLADIYAELCRQLHLPAENAPLLSEAELETERSLLLPNPRLKPLFDAARAAGKRVLILSDTYFPAAFIHERLTAAGFEVAPADILASCELDAGKYDGSLYRVCITRTGINPARTLQVGDNLAADVHEARRAGWLALHHPWEISHRASCQHNNPDLARSESRMLAAGYLAGLRETATGAPDEFWWNLGARTLGPLLIGFCTWLNGRLQENRPARVRFLLRDGYLIERVFSILYPDTGARPPSGLLHTSRRAFRLPGLTVAETFDVSSLVETANPQPVRSYLERLNLPADRLAAAVQRAGFASLSEVVPNASSCPRILALFRAPEVLQCLSQRAQVERRMLLRYLENEGLLSGEPVALVELGWRCSVQKALVRLLESEGKPAPFTGYYLGTSPAARDPRTPHLAFESYLYHCGEPLDTFNSITSFRELLEISCSRLSGSLRCFTKGASGIEPVLDPLGYSSEQQDAVRRIQEGVLAFATTWKSTGGTQIPAEVAGRDLLRLIEKPTRLEARMIGGLEQEESMGSTARKPLARFRPDSRTAEALYEDWDRAYWKQGLLALDTPQALATRSLLAAMDIEHPQILPSPV